MRRRRPSPDIESHSRREFLSISARLLAGGFALQPFTAAFSQATRADRNVRITGIEVFSVNVTQRTNWIILRLNTNAGISGYGEASLGGRAELAELNEFYAMVDGRSPFAVAEYRAQGRSRAAAGGRVIATAFSAIEQALWDLSGKILDAPFYDLVGGKLRDSLGVYANINRATVERTPAGFAETAQRAVADGFAAIKAAPFDGFPVLTAPAAEIDRAKELGIACVYAMRDAVGEDVAIKIDAHSFFDVELAIEVARELDSARLSWFEEPVAPTQTADTKLIHDAVSQTIAGGEFLFGMEGFWPLCEIGAVDIIMPDVKHCGGLMEATHIAAIAQAVDVRVSPHNPSGPISTAASVALCATLPNFEILEYQWGEVEWRGTLVEPAEIIEGGAISINGRPGFGIDLNERVLEAHRL